MRQFTKQTGKAVAMFVSDIDTDQILPKQFLTRTDKAGFGDLLFFDLRYDADGNERPDFILNKPENRNASILIAGPNFGSGSSREHAPWALDGFGFRVVIAPSFANIFYNNCLKVGVLPVVLDEADVRHLAERADSHELNLTIDLEHCLVRDDDAFERTFTIDAFRRECLLNGWDDLDYMLQFQDAIARYETARV